MGALLLLGAARSPGAIALASPGLWEFTDLPGAGGPARQCLANTGALARLEHRDQNCREHLVSQTESSSLIHYTCANGGYGQTKVTMLTPRSLRIETQGISANYPFNYKIQARRVGECPAH
ncbi:MAG: hypothetical protein H0V46_03565 [Sphingomonas sp.]|nr:hypothetical protein [Sphingomonas sp.]